jgi:hypothetical protein
MRHRFPVLGAIAALLLGAGAAPGQDKGPIELSKDPTTPVIVLDFEGGGIIRKDKEPHLVIRADGTVTVGNPFGFGKRVQTRIPAAEVQALLRYAIREQQFFDFDAEKVKAAVADEMKKSGMGIAVGGGSTTVIRIKTAAKEHEGRYYAASAFANQYKDLKALAQFVAVERRLSRAMYEATAGGPEEVGKLVQVVNERLKKEYPDAAPLTAADLQSARWQGEDTLVATFTRMGAQPNSFVTGTVTRPAKGEAKVFVKAQGK